MASSPRRPTALVGPLATLSFCFLAAAAIEAQSPGPAGAAAGGSVEGPAPPVAPAVVSRDETGRATVRAIRLETPIRLDGRLDDAVYASVPPIDGFIQQ